MNNYDDFINVGKWDPKVQIKIKDISDKYKRLHYNYQSNKLEYDSLIRNVILKEIINLMGNILVGLDMELKMKISRLENLESRLLWLCNFVSI